jgi:glycosyltransferase involved in cell wall biosynthesis
MTVRPLLVLAASEGGVGRYVTGLASGFSAAGLAVHVAGPAATGSRFRMAEFAPYHPVEIADRPRPAHDLRAVTDLAEVIRRVRPDVIHAHGLRAGVVAVLAGRRPGRRPPLVVSWHNALLGSGPRRTAITGLELLVARGADVTLGASSDLVGRAGALGARDARLGPVAAPVRPAAQVDRDTVRDKLGLGPGPVLLTVGRLAPQKDYPSLLDAVGGWADLRPQPLLVVVGVGPLADRIRSRIDAAGLPVRLLGARDDVAELLVAADVAVISSRWEARSLFAQEVLAAGVPLVATRVGGIPELVADAALLVPPEDPAALGAALRRVLTDADLRAGLAAAGPAQAAAWPTEEDGRQQLIELYREITARR